MSPGDVVDGCSEGKEVPVSPEDGVDPGEASPSEEDWLDSGVDADRRVLLCFEVRCLDRRAMVNGDICLVWAWRVVFVRQVEMKSKERICSDKPGRSESRRVRNREVSRDFIGI